MTRRPHHNGVSRVSPWSVDVGHQSAEPSAGSFECAIKIIEERSGSEAVYKYPEESGPLQGFEEGHQSVATCEILAARRYEMPGFFTLLRGKAWQECAHLGIGQWQECQLLFRVEFGDKTCRSATEPSPVCVDQDWS